MTSVSVRAIIALASMLLALHVVQGQILTPPEIDEQPLISTIKRWGDEIAIFTETYDSESANTGFALYVVPELERQVQIRKFDEVSCESFEDVLFSELYGKFLLCRRDGKVLLYEQLGDGWNLRLERHLSGASFRMTIDGDSMVVMSNEEGMWWRDLRTSDAESFVLGQPGSSLVAEDLALRRDVLYVAVDNGEWGGGLFSYDLERSQSRLEPIINDNVFDLALDGAQRLWIGAGLSHLACASSALYSLDERELEMLSSYRSCFGQHDESAGVEWPGSSALAGLTLDSEDIPIVVLPSVGIFKFTRERFEPVVGQVLRASYTIPETGPGVSYSSRPVGIAADGQDNLYVAQRSLGVLLFSKNDGYSSFSQLLLE